MSASDVKSADRVELAALLIMFDINNGRNFTNEVAINGQIDKTAVRNIMGHLKSRNTKHWDFS